MNDKFFESTFSYKLIYIFRINDLNHKGILKIGDTLINTEKDVSELCDNSVVLNDAAKSRINSYTKTAGITYELLYTTLAITDTNKSFRDYQVHEVLRRSGIDSKYLNGSNRNEWFEVDLDTAKKAIFAVKKGISSLQSNDITKINNPIIFRPEQSDAIEKTIRNFKTSDRMLWNAKMRFGKTVCALEIVRRQQYGKTIILTHRPVVDDGWFEDFNKIFCKEDKFLYGSKNRGERINDLVNSSEKFVYFASIQDLRGSEEVGGKFKKNEIVFNTQWDFVVIDEAHEGTKTDKGEKTIEGVIKINDSYPTKLLELSGTPFNLLNDYEEKQIYTWDYVMEQSAKLDWELNHDGDCNPYSDLPKMNIFTYDLNKQFKGYVDIGDKSFNFREFFKTWTGNSETDRKVMPFSCKVGDFIHEEDVIKFLNLLTIDDVKTNYPYSKQKYREYFRHSLWMVPGVKEAKALSVLLKKHPVFGSGYFKIVNVAGDGDEEDTLKSKQLVDSAITDNPNETYTITLSCGRLTTGVSVPAWTAVFMLSGSNSTSASGYLQTIFRVQTPANIGGRIKEMCYVFDFAPDRTLKMLAEAGQLSCKPGSTEPKTKMGDLLNFCPVISVDGSRMIPYNVDKMLQTLKKAYADRVVKNGFDDTKIYNDKLLKLDGLELEEFENLQKIIGSSKQSKAINEIDINQQGFTNEEYEKIEKLNKKPKHELSEEEKARLEDLKKKKDNAHKAISILRGISIRIPLLIYGANIEYDKEVSVDNFTDIIDDISWNEFMPRGVNKEEFKKISKYYDPEIFIEAGNRIRNISKYADTLNPTERIKEIANLFSTFKNPDKETVLTPWKTVNRHLGDCIGGYNFFDDQYIISIEEPRYISRGESTLAILNNKSSKVLEINSKSGLYPLYITYSIFRQRCLDIDAKKLDEEVEKQLWKATIEDNIFVLCKSPMAKSITERTLMGYNHYDNNIKYYDNLVKKLSTCSREFIKDVKSPSFWKKAGENMKFDAIVGNPPYQELVGQYKGTVSQANPVYNLFVENATKITARYVSMITPSLWMTSGTGLSNFRKYMLDNNHISVLHDFENSDKIFNNVAIAGGVSYFLWDNTVTGNTKCYFYRKDGSVSANDVNMAENGNTIYIRDKNSSSILNKVGCLNEKFDSFMDYISSISPFAKGATGMYDNLYEYEKNDKNIIMYRYSKNKDDKYAFVKRDAIIAKKEWIDKHKVFVSKAGEVSARFTGLPFYGAPGTACNETYIVVGPFDSESICKNVIKYMNTSLYKYLISQIKKTQNAARGVYKFVPNQDFTSSSDIEWDKDLKYIDNQIFNKYGLSQSEIDFITKIVS